MRMMVPKFDWFNLDPEILSIGTCRAVRLKRIGRTFLIESAHYERDRNDHVNTVWKTVAISKGGNDHKSYVDAMEFLSSANIKVLEFIEKEKKS
jgi:hypothetical protein